MGASDLNELLGIVIGAACGVVATCVIGGCVVSDNMHFDSEIIKHGAAYHHPETGEFTWKSSTAAEPQEGGDL